MQDEKKSWIKQEIRLNAICYLPVNNNLIHTYFLILIFAKLCYRKPYPKPYVLLT